MKVRFTEGVTRVTHKDSCLDLRLGSGSQRTRSARDALIGVTTCAEGIIEDLSTLQRSQ